MQENLEINPQETSFRDYLRVIVRRRKTFFLTFFIVFAAVAVYTYRLKPVYEAGTTLHVGDQKGKQKGGVGELGIVPQGSIDSEIAILMSRSNAEQVVKRLHLDWQVTKKSKGLAFKVAEFGSDAPIPFYHVTITGPASYAVADADGRTLGNGQCGVLCQLRGLRLLITDMKGKAGDKFNLNLAPSHQIAARIIRGMRASELGSKTSIIYLSYSDTDPVLARNIVNNMAQVYLEQSIEVKSQEADKSLEYIEAQMKSVQGDLDVAEKNLQDYKVSTGIFSLDALSQKTLSNLMEADKEKGQVAIQKSQLAMTVDAIRDGIAKGKPVYPPDAAGTAIADKITELEAQKRVLLTALTDSHPQVQAIQTQINDMQRKLLERYEAGLKNLDRTERTIARQIERYEGELKTLPAAELGLARLLRHAKVNSEIYTFLLQRYQEARILKASTTSNVNVVDPAITPQKPVRPNKRKNMMMGFLIGCMTGIGMVFLKEYLDDTVKDAEMARRVLGAPVLAVIPYIISKAEGEEKGDRTSSLVTQLEPKSSVSESFRSLRTSIHFSAINKKKQIFLVTSTFPGEGKTTIIANLAVTLVQTGARVLLLDCDLRRPALHELFGHTKVPGVTEILAGDTTVQECRHDTGIPGLDFVSAGTSPPNPSELLGSEEMAARLEKLRESYDYILIDAPPVLAVTDAPLLTARCDIVLIVLETGRVPVKAAQRMGEMLVNVRAPVAGLVINDKSGRSLERYGYYGKSYYGTRYYGYGYGYYSEDEKKARAKKKFWKRLVGKFTVTGKSTPSA